MIKTLLWDVDGTLLDFHAAESAAVKHLFREFGLGECTDTMVSRYSAINDEYWQRLERNEITKDRVLVGRYEQFFTEMGIDPSLAPAFNRRYQLSLGDTIVYRDNSPEILKALQGHVKQYAVSNGTVVAQSRKLSRSGLGALLDGIFLSEDIGVEKPNIGFFERIFSIIRPGDPSEVMIVGDSLTSDIRGGNNAGIRTCWYNPARAKAPAGYRIDEDIADLHELLPLLLAE